MLYRIFSTAPLLVIQWNVFNFLSFSSTTCVLPFILPVHQKRPSCSLHYCCKFIPTFFKWSYQDQQYRVKFLPLQSGHPLYSNLATVLLLVLLWPESISSSSDRSARWAWLMNRLYMSAPFCCSATSQTPMHRLHLGMCPPSTLAASCPCLTTTTYPANQSHSHLWIFELHSILQ